MLTSGNYLKYHTTGYDAKIAIKIDIVGLLVVNIMVDAIATMMVMAIFKVADVVMDMMFLNHVFYID